MKKIINVMILAACMVALSLISGNTAFALLKVNVMPSGVESPLNIWDSGPYTWPGNALELWGNVSYDGTGTLTYTWEFGAGEGSASGTVSDRKNIYENHVYASQGTYVATLTVTDGTESDTDTVYIDVVPQTLDVQVDLAIQRGLKYLYMNKYSATYGGYTAYYWPSSYTYEAGSWMAVMAFQNHGHLESNDQDQDIYAETVEGGMNLVFRYLRSVSATMNNTTYTDSDINNNGKKAYCYSNNSYRTGILAMTLAGTVTPDAIIRPVPNAYGDTYYHGKTYKELLEDVVDYVAYAQKEGTSGYAGGWRYNPNYGSSDNSVSQWPALGLGEAERAPFEIDAPNWVKTRLPIWITYSQNAYNGGFGYTSSGYWVNIAKTGAGIVQIVYAGSGGNLTNAVNFIATNWNTTSYDYGNIGDHYAMYAVKKGMEYANLSTVGGHDWQEEYNQWYVNNQVNNGTNGTSWNGSVRISGGRFATALGLLVMAPLEVCKPIADAGVNMEVFENDPVNFDGSDSTHTCVNTYTNVLYEWDFDYDGINFTTDAIGEYASNGAGYAITNGTDTQDFTVGLRVTDDQDPAKTSVDTLIVTATNGNVAPVAHAGGPYLAAVGVPLTLNGAESSDANTVDGTNPIENAATASGYDEIVLYQWDLDGDSLFGTEDDPDEPEGMQATVTYDSIGTQTVSLKVTDSFGKSAAQSSVATTVAVSDLYPLNYELVSRQYNRRSKAWTYTWSMNLINSGTAEATEVTATLTTTNIPFGVTVSDDDLSWTTPDNVIDAGEVQVSDDTFTYTVPRGSTAPDLTEMTWDIEFTDALGTRHVVRSVPQ